jgi:hypothetical protein
VREKHCWMAADSADKSKRTERLFIQVVCLWLGACAWIVWLGVV